MNETNQKVRYCKRQLRNYERNLKRLEAKRETLLKRISAWTEKQSKASTRSQKEKAEWHVRFFNWKFDFNSEKIKEFQSGMDYWKGKLEKLTADPGYDVYSRDDELFRKCYSSLSI
jgi:vacuolar-type H+-ATPase subunit D/Vma8